MTTPRRKRTLVDPAKRGHFVTYRGGDTPCPGCGRSNWYVGRMMAECAFDGTAIPLEAA